MATMTVVDVGHGNSAVVQSENRVIVIDAGPRGALLEFLRDQHITRVDLVLLSHADTDHIAGLVGLLSSGTVSIGQIRVNSDADKGSALWSDLLAELEANKLTASIELSLSTAQSGSISDDNLELQVLWPSVECAGKGPGGTLSDGTRITAHMMSAVIRIVRKGKPVAVLLGDIDQSGFRHMQATGVDLGAPVVVFPHHGGGAASNDPAGFTKELCEAIAPQLVAFSIGRGRYATPQPVVIQAIRKALPESRIACTQLSEHCAKTAASEGLHLSGSFAAGRQKGHCCAGSMVLALDDPSSVAPAVAAHVTFIAKHAPEALCRT